MLSTHFPKYVFKKNDFTVYDIRFSPDLQNNYDATALSHVDITHVQFLRNFGDMCDG